MTTLFFKQSKFRDLIFIVIGIIVLSTSHVNAMTSSDFIAYPVPLDPQQGILHINNPKLASSSTLKVKIVIYDINGTMVLQKEQLGLPILWNGFNENGFHVKTGLYIIKLTVEDTVSGEFLTKIYRVPVRN